MSERSAIRPGERFADIAEWDRKRVQPPHLHATLGYRRLSWSPGASAIAWDATEDYAFPTAAGPTVQGGLVTALLDAAMGGSCWTVLNYDEVFLTADLRVEFFDAARVGTMTAFGWVVRRTRRVAFCAAELHRGEVRGEPLATSRCTQIILPADGKAGRYGARPETAALDSPSGPTKDDA